MIKWLVPTGAITIDIILLFYNYKNLKNSRFSGDHFPEKSMYNDTAKKDVRKPESKMGQPKKVCITTPQKRTYGSAKLKWDNRKKYV